MGESAGGGEISFSSSEPVWRFHLINSYPCNYFSSKEVTKATPERLQSYPMKNDKKKAGEN